jgi:hypothetical protein
MRVEQDVSLPDLGARIARLDFLMNKNNLELLFSKQLNEAELRKQK